METIEINIAEQESELHLLPCKIMFNGESEVKSYFSSSILKCEQSKENIKTIDDESSLKTEVLETGFRGRPLNGLKITLPHQMTGLVIDTETKEKTSSKMLKNVFREIHSWQLDEPEISDKTEPFAKALKWFYIAKIIHSD